MLRAAVIGLGNIGFQFSLEPFRKSTWSHVSAYEKCRKTQLVGAVEIDNKKTKLFQRCHKNTPVFSTVKELMKNIDVDIVSICTPTVSHFSLLKELLQYSIKGVFCEKPITRTIEEAQEVVRLCAEKKILLAVNHTRRWDKNYIFIKKIIQEGKIGKIQTVNAIYSGQVFNIGTHLFDAIRMLIQKDAYMVGGVSENITDCDPDISGWIKFHDGIFCTFIATGIKMNLIFEIDVIGSEGRVRISNNDRKIERFSFESSGRYAGYRELFPQVLASISKRDRFVEAINDIALVIEGKKDEVECSGRDGLISLNLSYSILKSAKERKPIKVSFKYAV